MVERINVNRTCINSLIFTIQLNISFSRGLQPRDMALSSEKYLTQFSENFTMSTNQNSVKICQDREIFWIPTNPLTTISSNLQSDHVDNAIATFIGSKIKKKSDTIILEPPKIIITENCKYKDFFLLFLNRETALLTKFLAIYV